MSYDKIAQLVKLLAKRTEEGAIDWRATEREDAYQCSFTNTFVRIFREERIDSDGDKYWTHLLMILDKYGTVIEELDENGLREATRLWRSNRITLSTLFELARRKARGVEAALDEVFRELGEPYASNETPEPPTTEDEDLPF